MIYGEINGKREKATPKARAACPCCKAELIPKCGDINIWHWAHAPDSNCDPWRTGETDWHLNWKSRFDPDQIEIVVEKNGVRHIADAGITKPNGGKLYFEFQNSPITPPEIKERDKFYGDVAWVFNVQDCYPDMLDFFPQEEHSTFRWKHARAILSAKKLFLDYKQGSGRLFLVKNFFDSTPVSGWGLVIDSWALLDFATMEGTYNGFYSENHKEIQAMFEFGCQNISAEYKENYFLDSRKQFEEKGFLTDKQVDYLIKVTGFYAKS